MNKNFLIYLRFPERNIEIQRIPISRKASSNYEWFAVIPRGSSTWPIPHPRPSFHLLCRYSSNHLLLYSSYQVCTLVRCPTRSWLVFPNACIECQGWNYCPWLAEFNAHLRWLYLPFRSLSIFPQHPRDGQILNPDSQQLYIWYLLLSSSDGLDRNTSSC